MKSFTSAVLLSCVRVILLLSFVTGGAAADVRCVVQETPRQCMRRLIAARAYENAQADLAAVTTGASAVSSPIRSALKDFLSVVSAHLDTSTLNDDGKALILDYNLPGTLLGAKRQVKLQTVLTDPKLSDVVIAALASDPARASSLQTSLTNADDASISVTFNPVTQHFGRSLDPHRALFDSMMFALVEGAAPATVAVPAMSFDVPFAEIVPDAAGLMVAMADFETAAIAVMPAVATRVTGDLTRLVSNQPQLYVSGTYHHRKPVVGPVERGIRATWEIGTDNINRFRRTEGRDCEARETCLAAFNDYTNRTVAENRSDRLVLAVEYHSTATSDPALTTPSTFVSGKSHKFTYSLDYGREITSIFSGRRGRIDFALDYDGKTRTQNVTTGDATTGMALAAMDVEPQVVPQVVPPSTTRWSAATTITQPMWGGISVLLSVVCADRVTWFPGPLLPPVVISPNLPPNRGEPFSTSQRTVVAHVGVRYMVPSVSRPSPPSRPCNTCCCR